MIIFSNIAFVAWAFAVALYDCRKRRVTNVLIVIGLVAAVLAAFIHSSPFNTTFLQALLGTLYGTLALLPFFALRWMGAADVKVFAVLGAWCGATALLGLWIAATLAGGVHALVLLLRSKTSYTPFMAARRPIFALGAYRGAPYAAFLTGAAILWFAWRMLLESNALQ